MRRLDRRFLSIIILIIITGPITFLRVLHKESSVDRKHDLS